MRTRGSLLFSLLMIQFVSSRLIDFGKSRDEDTDKPTLPLSVNASCLGDDAFSLSSWHLNRIPSHTIKSKLIKFVNLQNNDLMELPYEFFDDLPNIECLNLAENRISLNSLLKNYSATSLKTLILDCPRGECGSQYYGSYNYNIDYSYNIDYLFNVSFPRLTTLHLVNYDIAIFNLTLPETLRHLYLERNQITNFVLSNDNLHSLYLDYNRKFEQIEVHSPNLEVASFKGCSLAWYKLVNFFDRERSALRVLDLSGNNFRDVSDTLYTRAKNLEILILNNNQITRMPELKDLPRLRSLLLSHNMITRVGEMQLNSLTTLSLRDNNITEIAETTFRKLPALEMLDLSQNILQYLPKGWADGLKQLKTLNLTSNWFASLWDTRLTPDFGHLTNLYLEENSITNITDKELNSMPVNSTIHLFGNWRYD